MAEKRRSGRQLFDLTVSNPTQAFSDYPHHRIKRAYGNLNDFTYRPDPFGSEQARHAIARLLRTRAIDISPNQLALTASTSEAYALLFKLLCNPADEILIPTPSYPLFEYLAALESVKTLPYRLGYDGAWFLDFDSLRAAISPRTKAIVVVSPNNPTGSFLKLREAEELFAIAERHRLPLISDEVFMDFAFEPSAGRLPTLIGRDSVLSFSLNGLSKAAGMPQMKLAWIAINGPTADRAHARERLELLLDTYLSVATPVQQALPDLLDVGADFGSSIQARLIQNRALLAELFLDSPIHVLHSEGGWSAILQVPNLLSEEEWITRLLTIHDVIVQPGYFFDIALGTCLVVSLITPPDKLSEGVNRLLRLTRSCAHSLSPKC